MSKYPRDEFDKIPESSARQGVHRARLELGRQRSGLAWISAFAVLALLVGAFSFFVLPTLGIGPGGAAPSSAQEPAPESTAPQSAAAESAAAGSGAAATESAPAAPAAPVPETSVPQEPASESAAPTEAAVDKTRSVRVLNGTGRSGLAGSVAQKLRNNGWAIRSTDNWTGNSLSGSVIYYPQENRRANAEAVGELLGITNIVQNANVSSFVTVVVGPGYR